MKIAAPRKRPTFFYQKKLFSHQSPAFTLVEMSVVLVIIGLLVGGVLAGQGLIHASQIHATIAQISQIKKSTDAFRDQYRGIPGDLVNARTFFPAASNGNGNGLVEANIATAATSNPDDPQFNDERSQFFYQLSLAGLLGGYDNSAALDKGYPSIKLHPSQGMIITGPWIGNAGGSNLGIENHATASLYLYMGVCNAAMLNVSSQYNDCAIFTPTEAWHLDTKLDDGNPGTGRMLAHSFNTTCTVGNADTAYNLTSDNQECNLFYYLGR